MHESPVDIRIRHVPRTEGSWDEGAQTPHHTQQGQWKTIKGKQKAVTFLSSIWLNWSVEIVTDSLQPCKEIQRDTKRSLSRALQLQASSGFNPRQVAASNSARATGSSTTRMGSAAASTMEGCGATQQNSMATGGLVSAGTWWLTMVKSERESKGLRILRFTNS